MQNEFVSYILCICGLASREADEGDEWALGTKSRLPDPLFPPYLQTLGSLLLPR